MITREMVVAEALTWEGTPFHHQARLKGAGVDCVGVIIKVAHALGISSFDTIDYARQPDPEVMGNLLREHLDPVASEADVRLGDIIWFRVDKPRHLGIVVSLNPITFIHAYERRKIRRVIVSRLDSINGLRPVSFWRYRGIDGNTGI